MKTVIMAGGKGTRIAKLYPNIPKPLIPMKDKDGESKPVLEWEICSLRNQGYKDIVLTVSYQAKQIMEYFGDGSKLGVEIEYLVEEQPLGNAGALLKYRDKLGDSPFLLVIADAVFDVDFNRFVSFHKKRGALVSLFTHPNSHPFDSSLLITESDGSIHEWLTKEDRHPTYYKNRVNAGLQIINPSVLDMAAVSIDVDKIGTEVDGKILKVDLDRQILKPLCGNGRMFAYNSPEYCKDMGTPERFRQVSDDFAAGVVAARNLKNKQKAIFLDRDGTINRHIGFLRKPSEFELLPDTAKAIRRINDSGYLAIVVTNQPVIARGEVTREELDEIHNKMETLLGQTGAYIDGLYYCPHHTDKGFKGEITELKIECDCRKPKPGLILRAAQDFNIDLEQSWIIGDGFNDVGAGKNAGCKTVLIGSEDYDQNMTVNNLSEAVDKILSLS